jgi:argininosuccinate synthase
VNNQRIVLAFNGHPASCAAVKWLADSCDAGVIALIVDAGQGEDPEEVYGRALACGASNAHVVDRCEEFARLAVVPAAQRLAPLDERELRQLTYPVIAAALVDVERIEGADAVAHASTDAALDAAIHLVDPTFRVLAPARGMHDLSAAAVHPDRHLLMRPPVSSAQAKTETATVTIGFERGVPGSVNGVSMELPELIESLSLIGRQCHVDDANPAPALLLLQSAYRESAGVGTITLTLQAGSVLVGSGFLTAGASAKAVSRTEVHA